MQDNTVIALNDYRQTEDVAQPVKQKVRLADAYDYLRKKSENHHDQLVPVKEITFCNSETIQIGSEEYLLKPVASQALSARLGVPHSYMTKIPPYLQQINYNYHLQQNRDKEVLLRFDGDRVRAIFSKRYVPLDHVTIVEELVNAGVNPTREVDLQVDDGLMQLNLLDDGNTFALRGDGEHTPGICVVNSEIGLSSFSVAAFVLRLVCTNGLIIPQKGQPHSFRHVSTRGIERLPQILSQSYDLATSQQGQMMLALDSPVQDIVDTLLTLARQFQLDKTQRDAIEYALPYESGETMFNVIQVLTKAAQYPVLTTEQGAGLQRVGGQVLSMLKAA